MYLRALHEKQIILTDDLKKYTDDKTANVLLKNGIKSYAVAPLFLEDQPIGFIEFGCYKTGKLSMFLIMRLIDLFPVFALAIKRSHDEWNDRVRAVIQKKFTAIHPTVEWKFREAIANMLGKNKAEESQAIEPIVFPNIVPIYGATDIRGSSVERSKAIQADLSEQLKMANNIITTCMQKREMPLLDSINYKISVHQQIVETGLRAGDEVSVVEFLKREINPLFGILRDRFPEMQQPVTEYFKQINNDLGIVYNKRKDFEDSLTLITNKVSEHIDEQQKKAQEIFPHYFEKYRTDGVEYNAYIGQSLVKDLTFDPVYLKSIKLWQLIMEVRIAHLVREIQPDLKTKLNVAQLILVHSNPFSIEFRQDENKFDVAGAYNIRYEITKKRIDKALVKDSPHRVTQVGKIAIIYSHDEEIEEYRSYINFMIAKGFITNNVEDLELEDLKGASGLKALRVEINFDNNDVLQNDHSQINHQPLETVKL